MFPLAKRIVGGYQFGELTFYKTRHLGTDYRATTGTLLFAPFNGRIVRIMTGLQGGKTIWFRPTGKDVVIRFMHLSEFKKPLGLVKEGDLIAFTGNTGIYTKAPHLHLDISNHEVNLSQFSNFTDPEKFNWK